MPGQRPRCADPARLLAHDWKAETELRDALEKRKARTAASVALARGAGWTWRQIGAVVPTTTARDRLKAHPDTSAGEVAA